MDNLSRPQNKFILEIATLLERACLLSCGLSLKDRINTLRICLAYKLRGLNPAEVKITLDELASFFREEEKESVALSYESRQDYSLRQALKELAIESEGIARALDYETINLVDPVAQAANIFRKLRTLAPSRMKDSPIELIVNYIAERLFGIDDAVQESAQEFIDRVLEACDPESAKAQVKKKGFMMPSSYKASVFDVMCEKFSYLREYHSRGKLVRDFRSTFRKHQK